MYNHEPQDYKCPLCCVVNGIEGDFPYTKQADIVYKDEMLTAFVASHWWPNNKGHILIVPNQHTENLYDIPEKVLAAVHVFSQKVAKALKEAYGCDGVSIRQHNEPAGDQDVWHYHLHVFPRYVGDSLYENNSEKYLSDLSERGLFVGK